MGTNFYWADDPESHIGKRSAAGPYCWDCDVTLCKGGKDRIHYGDDMYPACPRCGQKPAPAGLLRGPAAVELGFADPETTRPTGVAGCASFTWAQDPEAVGARIDADATLEVVDEYDRQMTGRAFLDMLANNCPVQFTDHIGREFS